MRRMITLGDPREEQRIIQDLLRRYHQIMSTLRHHDRKAGKSAAHDADQLRQEILRRLERLPAGILKEHLTRRLYESL